MIEPDLNTSFSPGGGAAILDSSETCDGQPEDPGRRAVLHGAVIAIGGVIGIALAVPIAGMLLSPLLRRPRAVSVAVGPVARFGGTAPVAATVAFTQQQAWRRSEATRNLFVLPVAQGDPVILSARCTHLGCQVRWDEGAGEFLCPCHGGRFDREGQCIAGPPPRPLTRLPAHVSAGVLYVALPTET